MRPTASIRCKASGMTLLEMTVVILVLMSLVSLLFIGGRVWKRGADRTNCIMNITNVQKAVRAYSNLYGYDTGSTAPNLVEQIIGFGRFVEASPTCPSSGTYSYGEEHGVNVIPPPGTLYLKCSLLDSHKHEPANYSDW